MPGPVATYPYHDASGQLVRQKLRYPSKRFAWQFPVEAGWENGYGPAPSVLYRLRAVLRAVKRGRTVHVCEGEKDADALAQKGVATTTPPQNEPWPRELAEPLTGAKVRLYWDDDQDGIKRAHWALRALERVGARVTCWRAAQGNDVADHLSAGLGVDEFVAAMPPAAKLGPTKYGQEDDQKAIERLADEAGPAAEMVALVLQRYADTVHDKRAVLLSDEDILNLPSPEWLVDGFIPAVGMTALWGIAGVGKSTLADDWTDQVRRGGDWNGYPVRQGSVLTLAGEGAPQYKNRLEALRRARGALNGAAPWRLTQENWDITTMDGLARVVVACWEVQQLAPLVLVQVDPVGLYGARNRDGVEDTELMAKAMRALGLALECAVIVFQHSNALGMRGRGTEHLRMYSETYCRLEPMGSREVALSHDGKNRQGELKAMRFMRESVGPGPVLMPVRGEPGDDYTPDDVAREQRERKEEAKEKKQVAQAHDPALAAQVLGVLPLERTGALSKRAIEDVCGIDRRKLGPVLNTLQTAGKVQFADSGRGAVWWRL
jgi:AAA domain